MSLLRILVVLMHLAVLCAFAAGYLARYVHPGLVWELQVAAVALPVIAVVVVAVTVVLLVARSWRMLIPYALTCALILIRFFPSTLAPADEGGQELVIMSFNGKPQAAAARAADDFRGVLNNEVPSLVALQEVAIRHGAGGQLAGDDFYVPTLEEKHYHACVPDRGAVDGGTRLPVFATVELLGCEQFKFVTFEEEDDETSRPYLRIVAMVDGRQVAVYNVHLRSFGSARPWKNHTWRNRIAPRAWVRALRSYQDDFLVRAAQAREIKSALDDEALPFLVVGDFNSTPHNWAYAQIARGLRDAYREAGRGWGGSYHARIPLVRIDHVLASEHWGILDARVLPHPRSDHRPLIAELILRDPEDAPAGHP